MFGKLFVVSTPIGNLEDITLRALNVLRNCDVIACEDTRITKKLLTRYGIDTAITSYHEHNEVEKSQKLLQVIKDGKDVALVSDAGTPSVSDPGWRLINLSIENDIKTIPVPGPSAVLSALTVSGLPTDSFLFLGFFPKTVVKKKELLKNIKDYPYTLVFYDSVRRLSETLNILLETLGERNICVAREMTKLYEEMVRGPVSQVISAFSERDSIKGEVTVVIEGDRGGREETSSEELRKKLQEMKKSGATLSDAVKTVCESSGESRNSVYKMALEIWEK